MNGAQHYKNMTTASASPHQLVQMLLDTFLTRIDQAIDAIESGNLEKKAEATNKALLILSGLHEALDMEKGGQISENLASLYVFSRKQIIDASTKNCADSLFEVKQSISVIRDAWDEMPDCDI